MVQKEYQRDNRTSNFPKKQVLKIVGEIEQGLPRKEACARYGMSYCTLCDWMLKYGSAAYKALKRRKFTGGQRREIVHALQEGKITKEQAALVCKVHRRTVNRWLLKAKQEDNDLALLNEQVMTTEPPTPAAANELQQQLKGARLKIKALETMIDIAEEQFNIPIRKKPGAKQ